MDTALIEILKFLDKGYGMYIPFFVESYMRRYIPNFDSQMRRGLHINVR